MAPEFLLESSGLLVHLRDNKDRKGKREIKKQICLPAKLVKDVRTDILALIKLIHLYVISIFGITWRQS